MRRAQVDVELRMLADVAPTLRDHGLEFYSALSLSDQFPFRSALRLTVEGWTLPEFCELGEGDEFGPLVRVTCTEERYGSQRLVKISSIDLADDQPNRVAA